MLPKGSKETRCSIEDAEAVRGRYLRAAGKAKIEMLSEFVATTGMRRNAVIRLLNRRSRSAGSKKRGRPRLYGHEAMAALKVGRVTLSGTAGELQEEEQVKNAYFSV